jgi:RNA polymerase sigma-70 factor, ECF subfamily
MTGLKFMETALTSAFGAAAQKIRAEEFDAIVRRHQRRVHRFLLMLLRDPDEADNLTQECFLRAYQNLASFRGESSLETWLLRIAANLARDHVRNRKASFWRRLLGLDDEADNGAAADVPSGSRFCWRARTCARFGRSRISFHSSNARCSCCGSSRRWN